MTTPSFAEAIKGLSLIADGARLLDRHFGALPRPAKDKLDDSILQQIDAVSVDRLRMAVEAMREGAP